MKNTFSKKFAFTLAEVLITLTIIGVVAALSIPTLISKYQKHTYVVGLQKAYAICQNSLKLMPTIAGCSSDDFECLGWHGVNMENRDEKMSKLVEIFSQTVKTDKVCATTDNCLFGDFPDAAFNYYQGVILNNGMYIVLTDYKSIEVDINGKKGPNAPGRDTFEFFIATQNADDIPAGTLMPGGSVLYNKYRKYNETGSTAGASNERHDCTKDTGDWRWNCEAQILETGKMEY